jgi:prepilin-type N-terminal cleavage/methylation domain-containing protein
MSIFRSRKNTGFTIVEILVACAVIGILAAVTYGALGEARKKARDKERITELKQLEVALRLYKDSYGRYPDRGCGATTGWTGPGPGSASWYVECTQYISGLVPSIMNELPTDPDESKVDSGYIYQTDASGSNYKVLAHDTVESGTVSAGGEMARCPASCSQSHCTQASYAVYSPGAACW